MENKNIIIAVLIIAAVIVAAAIGIMMMPSQNAQKDSKIAISGNKTLYEGDDLTVKLTDLNKTPIAGEFVNVVIVDKHGDVVGNESLKTDSKGKVKLDLELDAGKYTVNATFAGNDNFTGNATSKNITVKEVVAESEPEPVQQTTSESQQSSGNDIVESREFDSWDYAPGLHVKENTYANGDVEHYYDDGSYDYYDSSAHEWRYRDADGSEGSMYVGN